jgi:hypothetical protein
MNRGYFDAEKYFQRWAEARRKEVQDMERNISLIECPKKIG